MAVTVKYVSNTGAGNNDGNSAANAYTMALATGFAIPSDGVQFNCLAGTYTDEDSAADTVMDIDLVGTVPNPVEYRAYTSTIGDFTPGDAPPVIIDAGANTLASPLDAGSIGSASIFTRWEGFRFTGGSSHGFNNNGGLDDFALVGCKFDNNGGRGLVGDNIVILVACEFTNNTTNAFDMDANGVVNACVMHNEAISTAVTTFSSADTILNSLFYDNGDGPAIRYGDDIRACGNTFDGDGQGASIGIQVGGGLPSIISNNIFFDLNLGVNFEDTNNEETYFNGYNLFSNCTTDYDNMTNESTDISNSVDPFTDSGARDYTLASGSAALEVGLDAQISNFAIGSVEVTAGTSSAGVNMITDVTVNSVSVMATANVDWTTSHANTAQLLADSINGHFSSPDYIAVVESGAVCRIFAQVAGTGPSGFVVAATVAGDVTTTDVNMAGGSAKGIDLGAIQKVPTGGGGVSIVRPRLLPI